MPFPNRGGLDPRPPPALSPTMDTADSIQFDDLDQQINAVHAQLVATLRRMTDDLEALPIPAGVEPLTMLRDEIEQLGRRARRVLPRPASRP
jgi:hypothetical protein